MGKAFPLATRSQEFTKVVSANKLPCRPRCTKQVSQVRIAPSQAPKSESFRVNPERIKLKMESFEGQSRVPLARVVSDCLKRWFQHTLKEAKAGDSSMQVLVGQMYYSGYSVSRDAKRVNGFKFKCSVLVEEMKLGIPVQSKEGFVSAEEVEKMDGKV